MKSSVDARMHAIAFLYDHLRDFPTWICRLTPGQLDDIAKVMIAWYETFGTEAIVPLQELEKREIMRAITVSHGDVLRAADLLGVGKTTLYRKLRDWGYSTQNRVLIHQASALADMPGERDKSSECTR